MAAEIVIWGVATQAAIASVSLAIPGRDSAGRLEIFKES
jgi:hypothetical protein